MDESGNTGARLDDPAQPYHYLASVIVREDRVADLSRRLDGLAAEAPTTSELTEYHGQEMFAGRGPWRDVPPQTRINEYAKALTVLDDVDARIAYSSINKPALARRGADTSPHLYALQFLTEKIESWVRSQQDPLCRLALLVADQNHQEEQYAYDLVQDMRRTGGPVGANTGYAKVAEHIVDNVYFIPSERSRGIQLADLVAYLLNRHDRVAGKAHPRRSDQAVLRLFRDHIATHRVTWRTRWPS